MSKLNSAFFSLMQIANSAVSSKLWMSIVFTLCIFSSTAATAQTTVTYFHNDIAGSPMVATNASGIVVWKASYKPYGDRVPDEFATGTNANTNASNKIGYAGSPFDASTGLSYMGARYYDPQIGRFMGIDPVGFQEDNIHSFNRYAYANNNPYKFVDRDGRHPILAIALFTLAAHGFADTGIPMFGGFGGAGAIGFNAVTPSSTLGSAAVIVSKEANIIANGARGRASEARVLQDLGLQKNTSVVSTAEGRAIPDALTKSISVEIKDAASVSMTRQLRIQTEAAKASGRESILVTGERTCVSGTCSQSFDQIIRRSDLGPK